MGVVLALVLYLGSEAPVRGRINYLSYSYFHFPSWLKAVKSGADIFYAPANFVWSQPGLMNIHEKWAEYCGYPSGFWKY